LILKPLAMSINLDLKHNVAKAVALMKKVHAKGTLLPPTHTHTHRQTDRERERERPTRPSSAAPHTHAPRLQVEA